MYGRWIQNNYIVIAENLKKSKGDLLFTCVEYLEELALIQGNK